MNKKNICLLSFVLFFFASCNYQKNVKPTELTLPTPNYTMTALFEPLLTQHASQTPVAVTPESTKVFVTPSENKTPTETATEVFEPTNTETFIPSDTPEPTISYAGPGVRQGERVFAVYMKEMPNIDGFLGDWSQNAIKYPLPYVVYGKDNWDGDQDLSATVMFGWNEEYLFIGVRVKDDVFAQNQQYQNIYKGDSVELLIDTDVAADYYYPSLNWDDYQLGISPGNNSVSLEPESYLWYPRYLRGSRGQVQIGKVRTDNGYHLETAIPWSVFNVIPFTGKHFGFAFSVSDNDIPGDSVQQCMITNVKNRSLLNPATWGDLTLDE